MGLLTRNRDHDDPNSYDRIVAGEFEATGAVHAVGEARVNIERLHGSLPKNDYDGFHVRGSVHKNGEHNIRVDHQTDLGGEVFPEPADDASGFTEYVERRLDNHGGGELVISIKTLYLFPEPTPNIMKAAGENMGTFYETASFYGNVHSPGVLTVNIEDVYVHE